MRIRSCSLPTTVFGLLMFFFLVLSNNDALAVKKRQADLTFQWLRNRELGIKQPFPFPEVTTNDGYTFKKRIDLKDESFDEGYEAWQGPDDLDIVFFPRMRTNRARTYEQAYEYCLSLNTDASSKEQIRAGLERINKHKRLWKRFSQYRKKKNNESRKDFLDLYLKVRARVSLPGYHLPPIGELMMTSELASPFEYWSSTCWSKEDFPSGECFYMEDGAVKNSWIMSQLLVRCAHSSR